LPIALTPILAAARPPPSRARGRGRQRRRLADIVAEGFDAGVRLGGMIAQDMVACA
jgi:hypothetical protein